MNLLIDIGNTRIKWLIEQSDKLGNSQALVWNDADFDTQLKHAWQEFQNIERVAISSVSVKETLHVICELISKLWGNIEIVIAKTQTMCGDVVNSYLQPEKLGIDRWLCLIATSHYYPDVRWVIDCGTAITIDYIDKQKIHRGGLITAGLSLMKQALLQGTHALEFNTQDYDFCLANHTQAAIYSGTLAASIGCIEQALKMQPDGEILLTGGDAQIICSHLQQNVILDKDLVLKGLSVYLRQSL